jgi:hypothetical protein
LRALWMVLPWGSKTLFFSETYTKAFIEMATL